MYMLLPGGMDMLARKAIFSFPGSLVRLRTEIAGVGYLCFVVRNIFQAVDSPHIQEFMLSRILFFVYHCTESEYGKIYKD